ncbi:predicted protein [Aspergillus terreus NIH2624]|uniref:Uncharacterized protein n=1 Tax=Aspergillus terreus (strain NIH 2624 / FGSC A1156) TaxID=341663 RepID=Q0C946_ASPTN|nr:uncharacterized protein ATEG_09788 [Aspergillus terreus NIH2624]EAU29979.1 predicted protein [Aspergillus terreus NIH2624]
MASQLEILSNAIRSRLTSLVETLVYPLENPLVSPESLTDTDLQPFKIRRLDFDIENTPDPDSDILFDPLPQSKFNRHRINDKRARAENPLYLSVYPKVPEERKREWAPRNFASFVYSHLREWVTYFPRRGVTDLERYIGWDPIWFVISLLVSHIAGISFADNYNSIPNPYILNGSCHDMRRDSAKQWYIRARNEWTTRKGDVPIFPHLVLWVQQNCVGHDGFLQYSEIASLLTSMHARAFQRDIPADDLHPEDCDDTDGLQKFEHNPERLQKYPFAFKEECCFPILMVSFLGTDARLLFAYMDADTLVIRQSKLYSFEQPETAPWNLFARWLVGTPVEGGV